MSLASHLLDELAARSMTLATCESLTGGLIGATITSVPGASRVYRGGLVAYASDLKTSLVGVDGDHVAKYGVINLYTAQQMAEGAAKLCGADACVAVTGVAGPDPQDGSAPGSVWVGYVVPGKTDAVLLSLNGTREEIRNQTVEAALETLLQALATS